MSVAGLARMSLATWVNRTLGQETRLQKLMKTTEKYLRFTYSSSKAKLLMVDIAMTAVLVPLSTNIRRA